MNNSTEKLLEKCSRKLKLHDWFFFRIQFSLTTDEARETKNKLFIFLPAINSHQHQFKNN